MPVHAACLGPAGVEGQIIYNASHKVMQFCDNEDWIAMGGQSSAGITDGDKGDIVVSGTGSVWTVKAKPSFSFLAATSTESNGVAYATATETFNYNNGTATNKVNHYGMTVAMAAGSAETYLSGHAGVTLFTTGAPRLRVASNGYVGIGTVEPATKLHVHDATAGNAAGFVTSSTAAHVARMGVAQGTARHFAHGGGLEILTTTDSPISFGVNKGGGAVPDMFIATSGYVGLGTTSPGARLDVNGRILIDGQKGYIGYYNVSPYDQIEFGSASPATSVSLVTNSQSRLNITPAGNVGIGTVAPSARLEVAGGVRFNAGAGNYTHVGIGTQYNDMIISDYAGSYGGGIWLRVHDESISNKYRDVLMLAENGNVGMGLGAIPQRNLHIRALAGGEAVLRLQAGNVGGAAVAYMDFHDSEGTRTGWIGDGGAADSQITLYSHGVVRAGSGANYCSYASGASWTCSSDARMKHDVRPLNGALENIAQLQGVSYAWNDAAKGRGIGLIAQDVQAVYPDVVRPVDADTGMLGVDYAALVAPLIEAVKTLKVENDDLRARLERVEKLLAEKFAGDF